MRKFFSEVVLPAATGHGPWNGKKGLLESLLGWDWVLQLGLSCQQWWESKTKMVTKGEA